jgi:hypothetical protein
MTFQRNYEGDTGDQCGPLDQTEFNEVLALIKSHDVWVHDKHVTFTDKDDIDDNTAFYREEFTPTIIRRFQSVGVHLFDVWM